MKDTHKDNPLDFFLNEVRGRLGGHLKRVVLFGSRARGDETAQSDYDCLVIVDDASSRIIDIVDEVAGDALYRYSAVFSAFVVPERKLTQRIHGPFLINVSKEGINL